MKKFLSVLCVGLLLSSCCANGSTWKRFLGLETKEEERKRIEREQEKATEDLKKAMEGQEVFGKGVEPEIPEGVDVEDYVDPEQEEADELLEELKVMVAELSKAEMKKALKEMEDHFFLTSKLNETYKKYLAKTSGEQQTKIKKKYAAEAKKILDTAWERYGRGVKEYEKIKKQIFGAETQDSDFMKDLNNKHEMIMADLEEMSFVDTGFQHDVNVLIKKQKERHKETMGEIASETAPPVPPRTYPKGHPSLGGEGQKVKKDLDVGPKMAKYRSPDKKMLLATFAKFIEESKKNNGKDKLWAHGASMIGDVLFAEKLDIPNNSHVIFIADPHAEVGALSDLLVKLQKEGWIAKEDIFKLKDKGGKKLYTVFLGDYVDRGDQGAEILYIVSNLYIKNPDQVVVVRGNHEHPSQANIDQFRKELRITYGMNENEIEGKVYKLFDYLVSAGFLVWKNKDKKRGVFFTHGGINSIYSFKKLLSMPGKSFAFLGNIPGDNSYDTWSSIYAINIRGEGRPEDLDDKDYRFKHETFDREDIAEIFRKNCDSKELEIIGFINGHQHGYFPDIFEKGNGVHITSGQENEFQWNLDGGKELSLETLMKEGDQKMPFVLTFGPFRYNTRVPNKGIYGRTAFSDWHTGFVSEIKLKLDPDFKKCKFTREIMEQKKKKEMEE